MINIGLTKCHIVQREQLGEQLTERVGPDAAHLMLQLLQQPTRRLSAAQALLLPYCADTSSQQQSASQQDGDKGPGAGAGMLSTPQGDSQRGRLQEDQGVVDPAAKQTNAAMESNAMQSNAAESVSSHADHAASQASSHADGAQPAEDEQEESGQGRAPWWGAPLCR